MAEVRWPLFWSILHLQAMILVDKTTVPTVVRASIPAAWSRV
jgi:hypothetical protein